MLLMIQYCKLPDTAFITKADNTFFMKKEVIKITVNKFLIFF